MPEAGIQLRKRLSERSITSGWTTQGDAQRRAGQLSKRYGLHIRHQ